MSKVSDAVEAGKVDVVIVQNYSRIAQTQDIMWTYCEWLKKHDVELYSANDVSDADVMEHCAYVVQAIVNNFIPLLFIQLQKEFGIPISQITILITVSFSLQLLIDMISTPFIERIGYRSSMLLSNVCVIAGLILVALLPGMTGNPFYGILIGVCIYAVGGGLLEVLVSPIVEACPTENK